MATQHVSKKQSPGRTAAARKSSRMPQGSIFFERLVPILLAIVALLVIGLLLYIVIGVLGGTYA